MIEVKDRVPTKPNRIKLTNASTGAIEYYIWERADEPTEDGTPINKELFDSIATDIESLKSMSNPNLVVNGDFQVWQRGTSFASSEGGYTADRWMTVGSQIRKSSVGYMAFSELTSGDRVGQMGIVQMVDVDKRNLLGKEITLSVSCYATSNVTAQICIGYNRTNVKSVNVTTARQVFSITATVTEEMFYSNGGLYIQAPMKTTSDVTGANLFVEWVKLELGDTATSFVSKPYAEELNVCKYYCNVLENTVCLSPYQTSKSGDVNALRFYHCYSNTMRVAPSVKPLRIELHHGSSSNATLTSNTVANIGKAGCEFHVTTNGSLDYSPRLWVRYELDAEIY